MGFVNEETVYKLVFEDPKYAGLEVKAGSVAAKVLLDIAKIDLNRATQAELEIVFKIFAAAIVEWNLEKPQGTPVPATLDGLLSQDLPFVLSMIMAWMQAIASVPDSLKAKLSAGRPLAEQSIPMEML
jgi:hypothetical protein